MSGDLVPLGTNIGLPSRVERQRRRQVAIAKAEGSVLAAQANARVEAVAHVTETALMCASHISDLEGLLVNRTPHAAGRLKHIADAGTAGVANVVLRTAREVE